MASKLSNTITIKKTFASNTAYFDRFQLNRIAIDWKFCDIQRDQLRYPDKGACIYFAFKNLVLRARSEIIGYAVKI